MIHMFLFAAVAITMGMIIEPSIWWFLVLVVMFPGWLLVWGFIFFLIWCMFPALLTF